ncbi:flagellar hook capping FlgD N-terminal domain-containing protein [Celeribacter persicus]|jgi:Flagellar hook capping protein|uniref:Basal-body rod modification protein FlgD n=1 Tax=Celeribacter persicus TaxID=1651082 RepID=A0A2T5HTV4_9RHOB|nr:flagellar hook capping FlgD N-terminal domain-containing protein [Celeribacter persicus]PTQ75013.1 flagellar basal-body rod modification protein FlgD [Celeribacter persicus]
MVNTITAATTATATTGSASSGSSSSSATLSSDFDTFLKMLTVQMQNQDPLNPIESTDYAVQLATFSQVEQSVITNDLLEDLSAQLGLMGFSELSGWVGMDARSEAATYFDGSSPVTLTGDFATSADTGVLIVRDTDGTVVQQVTMSPTDDAFEWTGLDENGDAFDAGLYSFKIENYHNGDYLSTTTVESYSRIVEARSDDGDVVLVLAGGNEIGSDDVTALRDPS